MNIFDIKDESKISKFGECVISQFTKAFQHHPKEKKVQRINRPLFSLCCG